MILSYFHISMRKMFIILSGIIGLPGETVQVKDGYVYINGREAGEVISIW